MQEINNYFEDAGVLAISENNIIYLMDNNNYIFKTRRKYVG